MRITHITKSTKKDTLKSAIIAQFEEQYELSRKMNEELLNSLTIKELKKIHTLNEIALKIARKADLKEIKGFVRTGLEFLK